MNASTIMSAPSMPPPIVFTVLDYRRLVTRHKPKRGAKISAVIDRRYREEELFGGLPGIFFPEGGEGGVAATENISLGVSDVRHALRICRARAQIAFAVTGVLPHAPTTPRRARGRLVMIIADPKPAIAEDAPIRRARFRIAQHGAEPILASVNAGIFSGPLLDAFDKARGLSGAHRAAGIVTVFFEIEHEQNTARLETGTSPVRSDDIEAMFGLTNGI